MNKKSQITVFIIIGIIMLFSLAMFLYVRELVTKKEIVKEVMEVPIEIRPIKLYVETCIKNVAIPGLYLLGVQGGYIYPPDNSLLTEKSNIGYAYYKGDNILPTIEEMQDQMNDYMNNALDMCIDNFTFFKEMGYEIEEEPITTKTEILKDKVIMNMEYPITVKKERAETKIQRFTAEFPIRLGYIHNIVNEVVNKEIGDPNWINTNYLAEFNLGVNILPYDESTILYSISDNKSAIKNIEYTFMFANELEPNSAPELDFIPDFILTKNLPFVYDVNATDYDNDLLTFSDNTTLFDIDENSGLINFTPSISGNYSVNITVEDPYEKSDSDVVTLIIENE